MSPNLPCSVVCCADGGRVTRMEQLLQHPPAAALHGQVPALWPLVQGNPHQVTRSEKYKDQLTACITGEGIVKTTLRRDQKLLGNEVIMVVASSQGPPRRSQVIDRHAYKCQLAFVHHCCLAVHQLFTRKDEVSHGSSCDTL